MFAQQWPELRKAFLHTREQVYLNHAAVSPLALPVKQAMIHYAEERHLSCIENYEVLMERMQTLRTHLARLVGALPEQIALVNNTSTGLNLLATDYPWQAGDRVLLNSLEFPSNVYPFLNLKNRGVEVDFVKPRGHHCHYLELEDLLAAITPQTRVLSISHVQFLTGQRHDLATLGQVCRDKGIVFCVDAIQSLGATTLDVNALHIDFLSTGGHKWLMGPQGQGFVYIRPELQQHMQPAAVGWLSVEDSWELLDYQLKLRDDAARYELGTFNGVGITTLLAARQFWDSFDAEGLTAHILVLTDRLVEEFKTRHISVITPESSAERLGIVTAEIEGADAYQQALNARGVKVAAREGRFLRVSPHGYNSAEDIMHFFDVFDEVRG